MGNLYTRYLGKPIHPLIIERINILTQLKWAFQAKPKDWNYIKKLRQKLKLLKDPPKYQEKRYIKIRKSSFNGNYIR